MSRWWCSRVGRFVTGPPVGPQLLPFLWKNPTLSMHGPQLPWPDLDCVASLIESIELRNAVGYQDTRELARSVCMEAAAVQSGIEAVEDYAEQCGASGATQDIEDHAESVRKRADRLRRQAEELVSDTKQVENQLHAMLDEWDPYE